MALDGLLMGDYFSGRRYLNEHPLTPEQERMYGIPSLNESRPKTGCKAELEPRYITTQDLEDMKQAIWETGHQ